MKQIKIYSLKASVIRRFRSDSFTPLEYFQQYLVGILATGKKPAELDTFQINADVLDMVCERIRSWDIRCMHSFLREFDRWLPAGLNANTFNGVDLVEDDWVVFFW